ncbi:MAG: hypothetical protein QNJ46_18490 [Leptolyngbyaceae cyanobacterium MO_188.B28]|nr:hypothetical protein [Leptolyngbyaceae cyanobacterium MO_188.B28]
MVIPKSKYWFVPRQDLLTSQQSDNNNGVGLQLANTDVSEGNREPVNAGSPCTLLLKSFYLTKNVDKRGENDLLVRCWSKYGYSPQIETVHFLKKDVQVKQVVKGEQLAAEHILSIPSYQEENLVWLKLAIVDVKGENINPEALGDMLQSFQVISSRFGSVFPGVKLLPGALESAGSRIVNATEIFRKLRGVIGSKKERNLFEISLDFCSVGSGETPFCYGAYIFFYDYHRIYENEEVDGSRYQLKNFELVSKDGAEPPQYAVIEVVPGVINSQVGRDIILNQHIAAGALLSDEHEQISLRQMKRFEHLQKMLKKARQFDELLEYQNLKQLISNGAQLSNTEQGRFQKLVRKGGKYIELLDELF